MVALRSQELQIRHSLLPPEIHTQGNVHYRGTKDLWQLHSQQLQGRNVWLLGLAGLSIHLLLTKHLLPEDQPLTSL